MQRFSRRLSLCTIGAAVVWQLAACGGGGDGGIQTVATADTLNLAPGQTGQLLANDTAAGAPAQAGAAGNVTFALVPNTTLPQGVHVDDGEVSVDASATPGSYTFSYQICDPSYPFHCNTAPVTLTITGSAIVATADSFNLAIGSTGDVLANDTLGGAPASAATVTSSATSSLPAGISLAADGTLAVSAGAVSGTYTVDYKICQVGATGNCATAAATVTVPSPGMVAGRAIDAATGLGIASVSVRLGTLSTTTDSDGAFSLSGVPASNRVAITFESPQYAQSTAIVSTSGGGTTDVQARLVPVAASVAIDIAAGGTATVTGSPAQVVIPPNAVQLANGSTPTGQMTVRLTPLSPATDSATMPGDYTTLVSGAATPIESFGALDVQLADSSGAALELRSGQSATIRIAVSSRNGVVPASVPLYYFDTASGRWVDQGTAALSTDRSYFEGTVSHFTTWNADQVYNTVRVSGCVADASGSRIAGAYVQSDGVDYSGLTSVLTDAGGNFSLPMRLGSQATIAGLSAGRLTNTLRAGPYSVDTALTDCLALGQTGAGITMKLTWGAAPSDLDSHLWTPSGSEIFYGSRGNLLSEPFANLDVDDTSSYGPEVVTITKLMVGTYRYSVYNFSGYGAGSISASGARVELNIPGRAAELLTPPTGETSSIRWWNLFELDVDATCHVTVRRVSTFTTTVPTPATATPVYCTP